MRIQILLALCLITPIAFAQSPLTEWSNESLDLRFSYPSDLTQVDPAQVLQHGHLTILGISGDSDPALTTTRCIRPDLLVQLPGTADKSASILLAELDISCLTPQEQVKSTDLLNQMAELVAKVPGMSPIMLPTWYNIGWQKVYMAAAQGTPATPNAQRIYTMGFSTNWKNHLLIWYFSSSDTATLNRITKSTVRFGRDSAAPIYANTIGDSSPAKAH